MKIKILLILLISLLSFGTKQVKVDTITIYLASPIQKWQNSPKFSLAKLIFLFKISHSAKAHLHRDH